MSLSRIPILFLLILFIHLNCFAGNPNTSSILSFTLKNVYHLDKAEEVYLVSCSGKFKADSFNAKIYSEAPIFIETMPDSIVNQKMKAIVKESFSKLGSEENVDLTDLVKYIGEPNKFKKSNGATGYDEIRTKSNCAYISFLPVIYLGSNLYLSASNCFHGANTTESLIFIKDENGVLSLYDQETIRSF